MNKGAEVWHGSKASLDEYAHGRHGGGVPHIEAKDAKGWVGRGFSRPILFFFFSYFFFSIFFPSDQNS